MLSQENGQFRDGFDSLKWGMSPNQVKVLFVLDSISKLSIEYFPELIVKIDGELREYTIQKIEIEFRSMEHPVFDCIIINNKLCGIEINKGIYMGEKDFSALRSRFNYLTEEEGLFNKRDKYPYVEGFWRKDGEIIIEIRNGTIRLFQHEMKKLYDLLIQKTKTNRFPQIKG